MTTSIQFYEEFVDRNSAMNYKDGQYELLQNVRLKDLPQYCNPGYNIVEISDQNVYSETTEYDSVNNSSSYVINGVDFYEPLTRNKDDPKCEHIYDSAEKHAQTIAENTNSGTLKKSKPCCDTCIRFIAAAGVLLVAVTAILLIVLFVKPGSFIFFSGLLHNNDTNVESTSVTSITQSESTTEFELENTSTASPRKQTEHHIAMQFDVSLLHSMRFLSVNGSILSNKYTTDTPVNGADNSLLYDGVQAKRCFNKPTLIAWDVAFQYQILTTLSSTNLILQLGVSDQSEVQRNFFVGDNPRGWSFALARCGGHNNHVCIRAKHNGVLMLNKMYSENYSGFMKKGKFTALLNLSDQTFSLFTGDHEKVYTFRNIRFSSFICPVFGVFMKEKVDVTLQLLNATEYSEDSIPLYF